LEIAEGFLGLLEAAEFKECVAASFFGRHAGTKIVVDVELEVGGEFDVEVAVDGVLVEEIFETKEEGANLHWRTSGRQWVVGRG
jgi:hypothetical protein